MRSALGGPQETFIASGSDRGHVVIWHKNTGIVVNRLAGHAGDCNAVRWNPVDTWMLASGGDDGTVKIWTTKEKAHEVRSRYLSRSDGEQSCAQDEEL
ncbi:WD repeat-containing protein 26 [Ophiocordyceps camponoti-floridani]|uniref:WD repeat-containing protein 26 n=1 Tax=Ophiocordyceps camponoti-floridani TaxID=2030778 RepID=A0A8H4Q8I4_9HYPO|nr:WD repeat-containing protein 26 [Ophiocordyceps camponoti-floridani]